ncbi:DUF6276 family protein [Haladaptatus sp. GCM10025707]|uniref:DUF6276 family protein n=1 Tax=unclassified Haladaptatus TaxID=2622732 RepID=UPI0023E8D5EE|nr:MULTISPECIES: DUF6276 family protein [unclassified Haladaptatus]
MDCPNCGSPVVAFEVPEDLRDTVAGEEPVVALCTRCLTLSPATTPDADPDFSRVSREFPTLRGASVPMALLLGLLSSLAVNRAEIERLVERVERTGTDPLLVLDRLARDPDIEAATDLRGRQTQLEQFLD